MFLLNVLTWVLALTVVLLLVLALGYNIDLKGRVVYFIMAMVTLMTEIMLFDIMGVIKLW